MMIKDNVDQPSEAAVKVRGGLRAPMLWFRVDGAAVLMDLVEAKSKVETMMVLPRGTTKTSGPSVHYPGRSLAPSEKMLADCLP